MADDIDRTTEREETFSPYLISNSRRPEGPPATGFCHFCGEVVGDTKRFCDADCRDDYERSARLGRV